MQTNPTGRRVTWGRPPAWRFLTVKQNKDCWIIVLNSYVIVGPGPSIIDMKERKSKCIKLLIWFASLCLPRSSGCHLFSASLKKHQFVLVVIIKFVAKVALTLDDNWSNIKRGGFTEEWWLLMLSVFKQANQSGPDNQTISSFISPLVDSLIWRRESSICK